MATNTSGNLALSKPEATDKIKAFREPYNSNMDAIDGAVTALRGNIAIVQTGNTATVAIQKGKYVNWKGTMYKATANIASGATLSTSTNLTAVSEGGINTAVGDLRSSLAWVENGTTASQAIGEGEYVYWQGAMYRASTDIDLGATLSTANLTEVSGGALNSLNSNLLQMHILEKTGNNIWLSAGNNYYSTTFDCNIDSNKYEIISVIIKRNYANDDYSFVGSIIKYNGYYIIPIYSFAGTGFGPTYYTKITIHVYARYINS